MRGDVAHPPSSQVSGVSAQRTTIAPALHREGGTPWRHAIPARHGVDAAWSGLWSSSRFLPSRTCGGPALTSPRPRRPPPRPPRQPATPAEKTESDKLKKDHAQEIANQVEAQGGTDANGAKSNANAVANDGTAATGERGMNASTGVTKLPAGLVALLVLSIIGAAGYAFTRRQTV